MLGSDDVEQDYQETATKISKKGGSIVAKSKLFAVDNDDDHEERDMRFHDIDMNEAYEELDSFKDDGDKHMESLEKVNDLENQNDELAKEECEVPEIEEEHEFSQRENEAGLFDLLDCFIFWLYHIFSIFNVYM
ncbi:hypothetical protein Hanom_Chr07g00645431 [Helianthus anomalus]